ncbi:MAG: alpha/beta fold hydrolase [Oscillospiraceae bacterium]|nr:alpha/beta fold hydrolase [Oscillospiraceae bacterium]
MKHFLNFLTDVLSFVPLMILGNAWMLWHTVQNTKFKIIILFFLIIYYLGCLFLLERKQARSRKLAVLSHGIRLIRQGCICSVMQIFILNGQIRMILLDNMMIAPKPDWMNYGLILGNFLIFLVMLAGLFFGGVFRTVVSSKQVKPVWYLFLILFWWMPVINLIIFHHIDNIARKEFYFERAKAELDILRQESEICKTKYPVLLVHGIFFRDWQLFNYWGRIPAELRKNGACIFYGKQQSAQSIGKSAQELHQQIHAVLEQTGAKKINIIAHSKGGLDSRYAIAKLGDAPYVASLTTINTPHHGCAWVDDALQKIPDSVQNWLDKKYRSIFQVLGDTSPAFLEGVRDLTAEHCRSFNQECPVPEEIFCQCRMSQMSRAFSAPFPLWFSYLCMKAFDSSAVSDGLVTADSARLNGKNFNLLKPSGTRGISHGDMIDLSRENIPEFDVREYYVNLLSDLKQKGF